MQVFMGNITGESLYEDTMGIQGGSTPRIAVRADDSLRSPDTTLYHAGEQVDVTICKARSLPAMLARSHGGA
jgi:hypothetical protein